MDTSLLDANQLDRVARIASRRWGLHIPPAKRRLVDARLAMHVREGRFDDASAWLEHLERGDAEEDLRAFFDVLATNTTSFFRERAHFDHLARELYPALGTSAGRRVRLWSAGCSTGAEPYSHAVLACEELSDAARGDLRILATDLSAGALATARRAVYPADMVSHLDDGLVRRHFLRGCGRGAGMVKVAPHVTDIVTVRRLNLVDPWPFRGPFDVILCCNVMIYFDRPTRQRLVRRMHGMLREGGLLLTGGAETLAGLDVPFQLVEPSIHRRVEHS